MAPFDNQADRTCFATRTSLAIQHTRMGAKAQTTRRFHPRTTGRCFIRRPKMKKAHLRVQNQIGRGWIATGPLRSMRLDGRGNNAPFARADSSKLPRTTWPPAIRAQKLAGITPPTRLGATSHLNLPMFRLCAKFWAYARWQMGHVESFAQHVNSCPGGIDALNSATRASAAINGGRVSPPAQ